MIFHYVPNNVIYNININNRKYNNNTILFQCFETPAIEILPSAEMPPAEMPTKGKNIFFQIDKIFSSVNKSVIINKINLILYYISYIF